MAYPDNKETFPRREIDDIIPPEDHNDPVDFLERVQEVLGIAGDFMTVNGKVESSGYMIINRPDSNIFALIGKYNGADRFTLGNDVNDNVTLNAHAGNLIFKESDAEAVRIKGGNLGIQTNDPSHRLQVNGTARVESVIYLENIRARGTGGIKLEEKGGSNIVTLLDNKNVGINEETPTEKLHVNGNIKVDTGEIETTAVSKGLIVKTPDGTKRYRIRVDNAGNIVTELVA